MANVQVPPPVGTSGQAIDALIINAVTSELRQIHIIADPVSSSAMATVTSSGGLSVTVTNPSTAVTVNLSTAVTVTNPNSTAATSPWSSAPGFNMPMVSASSGLIQISGSVTATAGTNPWSSAPGFNLPIVSASSGFFQLSGTGVIVSASSGLVQISGTPFFNLVGTSSGVAIVTTSGGLNVSIVAGAVGSTVVNLSSAAALSSGTVTLSSVHTVTATAAANPWSSAPGFNMPVVNASSGMVQTLPASTGPLLSVTYVSSSSTNSNNVKGTPGAFYGFYAFNSTQSIRYIKLYNTTSAPTAGTTANQIGNYGIPYSTGGAGAVHPMPYGVSASNGIGFTIVSGIETTSTGTIGASDIALTVYYI